MLGRIFWYAKMRGQAIQWILCLQETVDGYEKD